ncbi:MAG: hypothetical protein AAGA44_17200 [Pseudomonadota bacterium]
MISGRGRIRVILGFGVSLAASSAFAAGDAVVGEWDIRAEAFAFGGALAHIDLTVEQADDGLRAYIYNGPVPIRVDGDAIEIDVDWATPFDTTHVSTLRGELLADGSLAGEVSHNGDRNFLGDPMRGGRFTGVRAEPYQLDAESAPSPVDLSGVWNRAFGLGAVRKLNYAMTPAGQAIIDSYKEMDNPNSRCSSMGLVMAAGMPYPMQIVQARDHLLIVYGADYVRRVYLDDREFPETATRSSLGFSRGQWHGETLVVTTTELSAAFMSTRGQPVSEDAYTVEHLYLDDRGYLHADMWLHDPENYSRPPYIRRVMDRDFTPNVITKIGCDPYSFFRALYLDGNLEDFWDRSEYRR